MYNIWDWQNSDLHSACGFTPCKINIPTKIIFKSILVQIDINMLSGKLFDFSIKFPLHVRHVRRSQYSNVFERRQTV